MRPKLIVLPILLAAMFLVARPNGALGAESENLIVGTGPVGGTYYEVGGALCRTVNAARADHGFRCLVESTGGSEENLQRLREGDLDFALIQSDWQYFAARDGRSDAGEASAEPVGLRAVVSLHAQAFTLLVAPESGIAALGDLEDKRLNLGPAGSAARASGEALIRALGWDAGDFAAVGDLPPARAAKSLCDGGSDAMLIPSSHPNAIVSGAAERCGARLLPVEGPAVDLMLTAWPFYAPAEIPGGLYPANPGAVSTFGLRATLVTRADVPDRAVFEVARRLIDDLDGFRAQHPALSRLTPEGMAGLANSLGLHAGADRYFKSRGLIAPESQ